MGTAERIWRAIVASKKIRGDKGRRGRRGWVEYFGRGFLQNLTQHGLTYVSRNCDVNKYFAFPTPVTVDEPSRVFSYSKLVLSKYNGQFMPTKQV
jgi:hypothetical protein